MARESDAMALHEQCVGKTDEWYLKSAKDWMEIIDAMEKLTGTEGTTDRSGLIKMIAEYEAKVSLTQKSGGEKKK